jgi:ribosomal protein S18 acetylase RimI-like enzyme
MESLYAKYVKERENKYCFETAEGFATYLLLKDHCYIVDIYVLPEFRQQNIAAKMADEIANVAKSNGYLKLLGSVDLTAAGCTTSMKVLLSYGFKLLKADGQFIYLEKDI